MNITIQPITDRSIWDQFLTATQPHTFLQAWQWGEFYTKLQYTIWRLGIYQADQLVGLALVIKIPARRGAFLLCPHGPVMMIPDQSSLVALRDYLAALAKTERCAFLRWCPLFPKQNKTMFTTLGFRNAPVHMQHPELSWLLDLTSTEDSLLQAMRKTTRYSIKKAQKDGVIITKSSDSKDFKLFWEVYQQTATRQNFTPFSQAYVQAELAAWQQDSVLFFAEDHGMIISTALIIYNNGMGFYHQGASLKQAKSTASYLLQWEAIREAKRRGCMLYNFWGIAPDHQPKHPWAGLSLFKKGFGGYAEEYVHAQDYVISSRYWLSWVIETVRRMKRGL